MIFSEESVRWGLLLIFSSVLSIYLSGYALHRRDVPGAKEFSFFTLSIALYSLGYAMEINAQTLDRILEIMRIEVFFSSFTAPAFLLFTIRFIRQRSGHFLHVVLLLILPLVIGVITFGGNHVDLLYRSCVLLEGGDFPVIEYESGLWHKIQLVFLISCSILAEIFLLIHFFRVNGSIRVQTILIFLGGFLPTVTAILNPERSSITHLDTQPFVFFVTIILLAVALFRFKMLDISQIARNLAIDKVRDSLLILDRHCVVMDINAMGRSSQLLSSYRIGQSLDKKRDGFCKYLRENGVFSDTADGSRIMSYEAGDNHYRLSITRILEKGSRIDGWLIHIRDDSSTFHLMKKLETQAEIDDLTKIYNRRSFLGKVRELLSSSDRRAEGFSLVLFDLDHFKAVNDNYGHVTGDKVLVRVADTVGTQLRPSEIFGRYGGGGVLYHLSGDRWDGGLWNSGAAAAGH